MKSLRRRIVGVMLIFVAIPFLIAGGLSRFERAGITQHPDRWMLVPGLLLVAAGVAVYGPRKR